MTDPQKDFTWKIRLDHPSHEPPEKSSKEMGFSRAEVIRRGIKKMHNDLKEE